ncbi:multicopper oxidase family protein [Ramlibacter tataouinensis]|uniref:Blue copper oxidase cueO (Copper efflux oxidase)-like protein n=1 Tax=Ramlibacter tataouinensis (strain ATCC BAA-407 / DSM 14655 / LMG 21543 / TTB310) TaxID=365046 RepID=F5Y3R9_RAMTT|nr:multicopper oxidase family protein [Ramlibacter tataouinensis]AEG93726.1 blue copper oxidase cueO precursor (Copper efflux oxidase)-like protein [Ramlibacter tataouinensis TTB310]
MQMPPTFLFNRRRWLAATVPPAVWLATGCAQRSATAAVREYTLVAAPVAVPVRGAAQPPVAAWGYAGGVPGPLIRARQGERLRVVVENRLPQETTVHWHGLRVPNAMDGVPHLTQPPIPPGGRFTYEFELPDAGTYWYHSHLRSSEQMERGLYGALVVDEAQPPPVDRDLTWVLDDWRLGEGGQVSESFGSRHDIAHAGRIGNAITLNGRPPQDLLLRPGERVRLRLVNAANARIFSLGFDGPAPWVVALDGQPVAPHAPPGGRVRLAPGMRCDLVLDAGQQAGQRHAVFDDFYPRGAFDLLQRVVEGQPLRAQPLTPPAALPGNPLAEPDLGAAQTHEVVFQGGMMGSLHRALLDGQPLPMMGLLRQGKAWAVNGVVSGGHGEGGAHGRHEAPIVTLRRGRSYVLALHNDTRWHHPIHLHGHSFRVLRRNGRETAHREWRDTVLLDPGERADIAFVADNPGDWMLHCHVLEHQEGGMMGVFRVA